MNEEGLFREFVSFVNNPDGTPQYENTCQYAILKKNEKRNSKRKWRKEHMAKDDRFEKVYSQGTLNVMEIWVDKETGVNYVFHQGGYAGGMTPLLGRDGKPVISPLVNRSSQ